jgi:hypothetical protein
MRINRSGIHISLLVAVLLAYSSYAVDVAVRQNLMLYAIGAIFSLVAALGAALDRLWAKPFIWSLGAIAIVEWVAYTSITYRVGYFRSISAITAAIALAPGLCMCVLVGYCCYVANAYIGRSR